MTKKGERPIENKERPYGGAGFVSIEKLLTPEQLGERSRLFGQVVLKPHCEVGHHEHHDEWEVYYILSGTGMYDDNGKALPVEPGDVFYCQDGDGHGIKNTGDEDLVFVALIIKTNS